MVAEPWAIDAAGRAGPAVPALRHCALEECVAEDAVRLGSSAEVADASIEYRERRDTIAREGAEQLNRGPSAVPVSREHSKHPTHARRLA